MFANLDPSMQMTRVKRGTRLVIDGYPRSGNSYARAAFLHANGEHTLISTHRHSPRSVEAGLRRGIPAVVLLRPPRAAIASALQYEPSLRPNQAVDLYRWFYEGILPIADQVLIAPFDQVTSNFGGVILQCNHRFGTDFIPYEPTPEADAAVAQMIDAMATRMFRPEDIAHVVARPSMSRHSVDEVLRDLDDRTVTRLDGLDALHDEVLRHRWTPT
ncbi:MAG TPA: hypothetical protein VG412_13650 [Acidimicrobiales bacterium]|nr:hypothetical protein [Acidimicrobiales bacterium]